LSNNAVVAPHRLSAEAGRTILQAGGNAVDAAIAAVATQGVVAPETCGLGGDLFALVHRPRWDRPRALNSSGRAGANVDAEALRSEGLDAIPPEHAAGVTIPGCVDGLVALSAELGSMPLLEVLAPATSHARQGFEVSMEQSDVFTRKAATYRHNPAVASFYPDGRPVRPGDRVVRSDLARTLEELSSGGRESFYQGDPGEDIVTAVGGLITLADMEKSSAVWVDPIGAEVAGMSAWTMPPNSQGYLGPGTLAVFEMLDPPQDREDPLWWHLLIESYRALAWERDDLTADPDHLALPSSLLLDHDRLARAASSIHPSRTGTWPQTMGSTADTAYLCVADSSGMAVSLIQSNYRSTGSPFGAARSGFLLQDRGLGFTLTPGHPNELAPGKRPLHTLSPTLWTTVDHASWILGTRGGAIQPQLLAQIGARAIIGDEPLDSAQSAPRWAIADFGPFSKPSLRFEPGVPSSIVGDLVGRGHQIETLAEPQRGWGPVSIIGLDDGIRAAADPRVDTAVALVF
jgi:gamma-glutamyltranspeptidase/glutathione hydrolase